MSDFWNTQTSAPQTGEFDAGGGDFEPIPSNTLALAYIDEAKWQTDNDNLETVSIRWRMLKPEAYKNRVIFQKLWISDHDPRAKKPEEKQKKARNMLAAIDFNAGGKIVAAGVKPTDELLSSLVGKQMIIKVMQWKLKDEMTGEIKAGNWIGAVSSKSNSALLEKIKDTPAPASRAASKLDDDIPF